MPQTVLLSDVISGARILGSGQRVALSSDIEAVLVGGTLRVFESCNFAAMFTMSVIVNGDVLHLDRSETHVSHRGRGWARLGLLLALRYGLHMGCTRVTLHTEVEDKPTARSFWYSAGIQRHPTSLQSAIIRVTRLVGEKCPQPSSRGTTVFIVRDAAAGVRGQQRRGSFS